MPRLLVSSLLSLVLSTVSNAATLSVFPDKLTYSVGETITLTVFADDEGAFAYSIFGQLRYNGALVDNGTRSQTALLPDGPGVLEWVQGSLLASDDGDVAISQAFNQVNLAGLSADNLPGILSTVTLFAVEPGNVVVEWDTTNPNPDFNLYFFGLVSAPGTSFTIVPEPGTTMLFGLGLLGLASWRRVCA
jgi:hypothetical protein